MSAEIASAYVRVRPNMTGFKAETESGVRGAFAGVGKIVGVAFGAVAVGEIVKSSVEAAATVQKQMEVIRNEFGKSGQALIDFAHTTGIALGGALSTATLGFSAQMGILYKNMGFTTMAGAHMTEGWERLGLAFNAVKGGGAAGAVDVLNRLKLAATGASTRGLRALGISLQSSTLQAYAFAHGITATQTQALQPAQKALITYQIAMEHMPELLSLAKAHSNDFANVQARLTAQWEEARIEIGNALLPAMVVLGNFLANVLPKAIHVVIAVFSDLKTTISGLVGFVRPAFQPIVNVIEKVRDAFQGGGGIGGAIGRLKGDFAKLSPAAKIAVVALGGIAAAFAAITISAFPITSIILLGVALGEAYRRSAAFREIVGRIGDYIKGTIVPVFQRWGKALEPIAGYIVGTIVPALERAGGAVVKFFKSATVSHALQAAFTGIGTAIHAAIPVVQLIGRALVGAFHQAAPLVHDFVGTIRHIVPDLKPIAKAIVTPFVAAFKVLQAIWKHFGGTLIASVKATFSIVVATIRNAFEIVRGVFDIIAGILTLNWGKMWHGVTEILGGFTHEIVSVLRAWGGVLKQFFIDLWHVIEKIVLTGIEKVVHLLAKIPTGFTVFGHHFGFTNPFQGWDESLKKTIDGIGKTGKKAVQTATDVSDGVKKGIKKSTGDAATKDALKKLGDTSGKTVADATASGVQSGVTKTLPALSKSISDAVSNAIQSAHKAIIASVQSAKNNLDKIGQDLAKTIGEIQAKLGGAAGAVAGSPQGAAFAKLKKLIESGAPSFEIAKAQAELNSQLQNVGKTQKTQVQTQLANLTAAFDKGKIGFREFESRLHEILRKDGITLAQALKAGGPAFADAFKAEVRALGQQAKAISEIPKKFRGIGGAGGAADIKIIRPLQVINDEQKKVAIAEAKARAAALKQSQKQTAYQQQLATVGVHVLPGPGSTGAGGAGAGGNVPAQVRSRIRASVPKPSLPQPGRDTNRVRPAHVQAMTSTLVRALSRVCSDITSSGKEIVAAELTVRTPIENLRRTEVRIADEAAKQREHLIREARRTNTLLVRLERSKGPVPGFHKERPGTGSHHARKANQAGVKV